MQNVIDKIKYTYDPEKFHPVFLNGKLLNRSEYLRYKLTNLRDSFYETGQPEYVRTEPVARKTRRRNHRGQYVRATSGMEHFRVNYYSVA